MANHREITVRQRQIIWLLTEPGASQQAVAEALGIDVSTVKNHLAMAYRTLGVRSLAQARQALGDRSRITSP